MQKKLWICLILSKNLYLKYRFFALFRRVSWLLANGEKPVQSQPQPQLTQTKPRVHGKLACEQSFPQVIRSYNLCE